ncbi:MAG: NfeD family protein [Clostridia bacterium]|nr:NfeD family protein [Clostridia bacterium]
MWQFWLILAGIFLIIEIITVGFLVFWFSVAALIAMIASFFIHNIIAQASIFVIASTLLLFITRPFVEKITKKDEVIKTNAYSIEGKVAKVIVDVVPVEGQGQIKINGETWSAKSYNDTVIPKDTEVLIEKIDGVKAIIKPLN